MKKTVFRHDIHGLVEVHRVVSRREDGSVFETEFLGFADRKRPRRRGEVVAPLSSAAVATIAAARDEGLEIDLMEG